VLLLIVLHAAYSGTRTHCFSGHFSGKLGLAGFSVIFDLY